MHATHTPSIAPAHPQSFGLCVFLQQLPSTGNHGYLCQHPWYRAANTDLKGEVAPGHLRDHWRSACNWREQIARPNLKAVMTPSAGQWHVTWGLQWLHPFFLPHHCITTFLYFSSDLMDWKMLFLSHLKCDKTSPILTGCAAVVRKAQGLLLHCEHRATLCHSAGPFQTTARFRDQNRQHSACTSCQHSREINISKVFWLGNET